MKSPLRKRIPRELKGEIGKYLVVFILMVATIGMVSGFLVADGSMIQAYDEDLKNTILKMEIFVPESVCIEDSARQLKRKVSKSMKTII